MKKLLQLVQKVGGIKKAIKLKKEVYRNLTTVMENKFWECLDALDLSKCDQIHITPNGSSTSCIIECFRINGYVDKYYLGLHSGLHESIFSGDTKWK